MTENRTTPSWWARAARGPRRRCCWPGGLTGSWSSTGRRSPATPSPPTSIHPPGVAALRRWGLLDRVVATGCPPIDTYAFDFGPFTISGAPGTDGTPVAYGPRRTVLDKLLVDAAAEAGAEVREGFTVAELALRRRSGHRHPRARPRAAATVTEHARVVVGADGVHSLVAQAVRPEPVPREAAAAVQLLHLLERAADGRPLRGLHPPRPCIRGVAPPTTT